jgi:uncharacterized protein YbdZ (MbtH family)
MPPRGTPTLIFSDDKTAGAFFSPVALDSAGNAIMVWIQSDGRYPSVWARRYEVGKGWGTSTLVETNPGAAFDPQIGIDRLGNVIVVWYQWDGNHYNIWGNRYQVGSGWDTPVLIETNPVDAVRPKMATDGNSTAIVAWVQDDGLWTNHYAVDTGWQAPTLIQEGTIDQPQVVVNETGNGIVVWIQLDEEYNSIYARSFFKDSGWGETTLIESNIGNAEAPAVSMNSEGNIIVVWTQQDGQYPSVWANRYNLTAGWEIATQLATEASHPHVVMDPDGNGMVVWTHRKGECSRDTRVCTGIPSIWARRYDKVIGWEAATQLATKAYDPQIAMDKPGNAIAVWGEKGYIWANYYEAGRGWGTVMRISSYANIIEHNMVAINEEGNVIVTWDQFAEGTRHVWANRFKVAVEKPERP